MTLRACVCRQRRGYKRRVQTHATPRAMSLYTEKFRRGLYTEIFRRGRSETAVFACACRPRSGKKSAQAFVPGGVIYVTTRVIVLYRRNASGLRRTPRRRESKRAISVAVCIDVTWIFVCGTVDGNLESFAHGYYSCCFSSMHLSEYVQTVKTNVLAALKFGMPMPAISRWSCRFISPCGGASGKN